MLSGVIIGSAVSLNSRSSQQLGKVAWGVFIQERGKASEKKIIPFPPHPHISPRHWGFVFPHWYKISVFQLVIETLPFFHPEILTEIFCLDLLYVRGTKEFSPKNVFIQLNQKDAPCSETGQDKLLNFKIFSKWVYITSYPLCPDYLSSEQPKKPSLSGDSCI